MKIITISRQYGAGGREIGLAVGKELGVTHYDRDISAATAKARRPSAALFWILPSRGRASFSGAALMLCCTTPGSRR